MKGSVTIPKWVYILLLVGAVLNILNFINEKVKDEPEIHIYYHDERKE